MWLLGFGVVWLDCAIVVWELVMDAIYLLVSLMVDVMYVHFLTFINVEVSDK